MYAFVAPDDNHAYVVFRVKETDKAVSVLKEAGIVLKNEIL